MTRKIYDIWKDIKKRVAGRYPAYVGTTLCDEWHDFNKFLAWYQANEFEDCQIDKDLLVEGNKHYSPETCIMLSRAQNHALIRKPKHDGLPFGVNQQRSGRFRARLQGKTLGTFDTSAEASEVYEIAKRRLILKAFEGVSDPRIVNALRRFR